jgi:metallo-beta-lactamase family protein
MTVDGEQSRAINGIRRGAIVIAGSGMCNGGRIRHHLMHNLALPQAHLMFVGYQAQGTLGRRLVDGAREVRLLGEQVSVRLQRHTVGGLSAHADQAGLMEWVARIGGRPPVVLVHGEDPAREILAARLGEKHAIAATLARPGLEMDV